MKGFGFFDVVYFGLKLFSNYVKDNFIFVVGFYVIYFV